ncbi:MAG: hypothetical protein KC731_25125, partial [Myxococcales bacterium]|nr:hypothetical protein [Myxococcales bacterium]
MAPPDPRPRPRYALAVVSAPLSALFAWLGLWLPWRRFTAFTALSLICALLLAATAVLAILRHRLLPRVWRAQAVMSLAWLAYVSWGVLSSAFYVHALYSGLGQGVALALGAVFGLVLLLVLPLALWGLAATGGVRLSRRQGAALLVVVALAALALWRAADRAVGEELVTPAAVDGARQKLFAAASPPLPPVEGRSQSLFTTRPADCPAPPGPGQLTLMVSYLEQGPDRALPRLRCLQAPDADTLAHELTALLARGGRRGPIKLDLVTRLGHLPSDDEPLALLAARPGLDGLCAGPQCLLPWQLVSLSAFTSHAPLPGVPDARLGLDLTRLRRHFADPAAPLTRIATASWLVSPSGELLAFQRNQTPDAALDATRVAAAARAAGEYVLRAQQPDGRFNYLVNPFTGAVDMGRFSVARQAGTTLALCELGAATPRVDRVITRSAALLASHEEQLPGERSVLRVGRGEAAGSELVGASALTFAALLRCRARLGDRYDDLLGRLARLLLAMQRPDGSFHHHVDLASGEPVPHVGAIYVDGQIVLGLVLLEQLQAQGVDLGRDLPLHDAVERAMSYFGERYWQGFARSFFFLEENW